MGGVSMTFGQKVRVRREALGFTQDEVGRLCRVSQAAIAMYENDKQRPHQNTFPLLCKALRCDPSDLADDQEENRYEANDHGT